MRKKLLSMHRPHHDNRENKFLNVPAINTFYCFPNHALMASRNDLFFPKAMI